MTGQPYNGGMLRFGTSDPAIATAERITWGNGTTDAIYLALMDNSYVQVVTSTHWSDISTYEQTPTGNYVTGGQLLTTAPPYIEATLLTPFNCVVYTANSGSTPAYSMSWTGQVFTNISGAVLYKKNAGATSTWPLLCFISSLSTVTANNDTYSVMFGTPGTTLGIWHRVL